MTPLSTRSSQRPTRDVPRAKPISSTFAVSNACRRRRPSTTYALWAAVVGVFVGCGQPTSSRAHRAPEPETPPRSPEEIQAEQLSGDWKWSHVTEKHGVRTVEREHWHFQTVTGSDPSTALSGVLERSVTFMSMDGTPFSCTQSLSYELRSTYQLEAVVGDTQVTVRERAVAIAPSPCESGYRPLTSYVGTLVDPHHLRLRWPDGQQTLTRIPPPARAASKAKSTAKSTAKSIAGAWRWHSRNQLRGEVRVETEDWEITDTQTGPLSAVVQRSVTVFADDGTPYPCNGASSYRYRDRYHVRGYRSGDQLTFDEVRVEPESHKCLAYSERHLDGARGARVGEYLVLTWRGGKRQVLHRPE